MMEVIKPGHLYALHGVGTGPVQYVSFVNNIGDKYPGNEWPPHGGIQSQDLIRVLIDRTTYLNNQGACFETEMALVSLRQALAWYEVRAARCMGTHLEAQHAEDVERLSVCITCGHIACTRQEHEHLPGTERR